MTTYEHEVENSKYKLLGFENDKSLAVIMVIATGKIIRIKLSEVLNSEIMDNLNKMEVKNMYKKFYSQGGALTAYDLNDRNENSWMIYIILNLLLFTFYIFTSIADQTYLPGVAGHYRHARHVPLPADVSDRGLAQRTVRPAAGETGHPVCVCQ